MVLGRGGGGLSRAVPPNAAGLQCGGQELDSAGPSYRACVWLPRYQLHSQEEAKERRHSHAVSGLPESDEQQELPSPPALPMALVGKGPLTSIGQCPRLPAPSLVLLLPWVLLVSLTPPTPAPGALAAVLGPGMSITSASGHLIHFWGSGHSCSSGGAWKGKG